MSDQTSDDHVEPDEASQGFRGVDILAALAVALFLAAIGLITFFVTAAFGS